MDRLIKDEIKKEYEEKIPYNRHNDNNCAFNGSKYNHSKYNRD